MAERASATAKKAQDAAIDVSTLQKRGRRRLVGAIALVLLAVIVLPMVFDPEPKPNAPLVNIRIPSEEGGKFTPKAVPGTAAVSTEQSAPKAGESAAPGAMQSPAAPIAPPANAVSAVGEGTSGQGPVVKPLDKAIETPAEKPISNAPPTAKPKAQPTVKSEAPKAAKPAAKAAPAADKPAPAEPLVYQIGAFAGQDKVREIVEKLKAAKLPHYTESVPTANGSVTRVRIGPFSGKAEADKAIERARALGLNPIHVAPK